MLMRDGMTLAAEPESSAVLEAAAIVEAEWVRLTRVGPPDWHGAAELPDARRRVRRHSTMVTLDRERPEPLGASSGPRPHWAAHTVWARERSPPRA